MDQALSTLKSNREGYNATEVGFYHRQGGNITLYHVRIIQKQSDMPLDMSNWA